MKITQEDREVAAICGETIAKFCNTFDVTATRPQMREMLADLAAAQVGAIDAKELTDRWMAKLGVTE